MREDRNSSEEKAKKRTDGEMGERYERLRQYLRGLGKAAVAFSGGVDSAFLLKTAHDVLGSGAVAVTVRSELFPEREFKEACAFCDREKIRQVVVEWDGWKTEEFTENKSNRCYICKKNLLGQVVAAAKAIGIPAVCEGSNTDDTGDYRPGLKAVEELRILSPLRQAGMDKAEIRRCSALLGLPTHDKPSFACLASRFAYGEIITPEKLRMIDQSEQVLFNMGFRQFRVRIHDKTARIEVLPQEFGKLLEEDCREELVEKLRQYGFAYVSLDLQGYRTGSMNETLTDGERGNVSG